MHGPALQFGESDATLLVCVFDLVAMAPVVLLVVLVRQLVEQHLFDAAQRQKSKPCVLEASHRWVAMACNPVSEPLSSYLLSHPAPALIICGMPMSGASIV